MEQQAQRDWSGCEIIEYDPLKMGGAPTMRGRRITPHAYLDNFNHGFSAEQIARDTFAEPVEYAKAILEYASGRGYLARPFRQQRAAATSAISDSALSGNSGPAGQIATVEITANRWSLVQGYTGQISAAVDGATQGSTPS